MNYVIIKFGSLKSDIGGDITTCSDDAFYKNLL